MNRCLHKDPHKLANYCTTLPTPQATPPLPPAAIVHPQPSLDDLLDQPIADDPLLAPGADAHVQDDQPVTQDHHTGPLLAPVAVSQLGQKL